MGSIFGARACVVRVDDQTLNLIMAQTNTPEEALRRIEEEKRLRTGRLDLNRLELNIVPPEIADLPWLKELKLGGNYIRYVKGLDVFRFLEQLSLGNNQLREISGLDKLPALEWLWLQDNQIQEIKNLDKLPALRVLQLEGNYIQEVEGLTTLTSLESLWLGKNRIREIKSIDRLENIVELDLSNNFIQEIKGLDTFNELRTLLLNDNHIKELKPVVSLFIKRPALELVIHNNPITDIPQEIINSGRQAIIDYFSIKKSSRGIPRDQIKLIFLGNSSSGKTSLSRFLSTGSYQPNEITTHGIYQSDWSLPTSEEHPDPVKAHIWDFGGQQYYHATHRLFLSHGAHYVVVCNRALEVNDRIATTLNEQQGDQIVPIKSLQQHHTYPYWLKTIEYYTRESKSRHAQAEDQQSGVVPVFMVESKGADKPEDEDDLELNPAAKRQFPSLKLHPFQKLDIGSAWQYAMRRESNIPEAGIPAVERKYHREFERWQESLTEAIRKELKGKEDPEKFPLIRDWIAFRAAWGENQEVPEDLRNSLLAAGVQSPEQLKFIPPWLSRKAYEDLVKEVLPAADYADMGLARYLAVLDVYLEQCCGQIMYFPGISLDGLAATEDTGSGPGFVCIHPQWLHDRIYDVLDEQVRKAEGRFTLAHVNDEVEGDIMPARQMVEVMKKFRLIFEVAPETYIAPQYLPQDCRPETQALLNTTLKKWRFSPCLSLVFPDYLPPSIITEFIAQKGPQALEDIYWGQGLMYEHAVAGEPVNACILCDPASYSLQLLLPASASEFEKNAVIRDFVKTVVVDIAQHPKIQLVKPGYEGAAYDLLCEAKRACSESIQRESGVVKSAAYFPYLPDYGTAVVNIFISYSHEHPDKTLPHPITEFIALFRSFCNLEGIRINIVSDLNISVGDRWRKFLADAVTTCDIFVGLVSQGFVTSKFINLHELGEVLRRHSSGQKVHLELLRFDVFNNETHREVREIQMFKPDGSRFETDSGDLLTWVELDSTRRKQYVELLFNGHLNQKIKEIWHNKTGL